MSRQQAEALTEHMTELICTNREKVIEQFVSKAAPEKVRSRGARGAGPHGEAAGLLGPRACRLCWSRRRASRGFTARSQKARSCTSRR